MAIVTIDVNEDFIRDGQKVLTTRIKTCPIALAVKAVIPNFSHVSQWHIIVAEEEEWHHVELPEIARKFIKMADVQANVAAGLMKKDPNDVNQSPLKPIKFQIRLPDKNVT